MIVDNRVSTTMRAGFWKRYDSDGTVWMKAYVSTDLTALTPYAIQVDEYGPFAEAIPNDTNKFWVGVPDHAMSTGDVDWLQIGGYVSGMITANIDSGAVGYGFVVNGGAVAASGADYKGSANEFAVATVDSEGNSTTHYAMLVPEQITEV